MSRILKTSILGVTAAAILFGILSVGNPLVLFADATAFLVATSAPQNGTDKSTPSIQATAGAQDLPSTASAAPTGDETTAAFKAVDQKQTEIRQPPAGALLSQFRAWAANEDARADALPAQPVQDAQPQLVQDVRPQIRPVQKHRQAWRVRNARAEIRSEQNRAKIRRKQNARVQVRRVQDTRAEEPPVPQAPSFLQSIGLQN